MEMQDVIIPNPLDRIKLPNHPMYRDRMRLWTSKLIMVPEYWSKERKGKAVQLEGCRRIAQGVLARYGEERELRYVEVLHLRRCDDQDYFVVLGYVPCNYDEEPEHKIVLPN